MLFIVIRLPIAHYRHITGGTHIMTCPHLRHRILYKTQGSGLIAAASYNSRRKIFDESEHRMKYPHAKADDHILTQMLLPNGAPQSYNDPQQIWNDLLSIENDKTAYNIIIPFQKELTFEQNLQLAIDLLNDEFVSKGHCVQIDVHDQKNGNGNFHLHAIVSDRQLKNGKWDLQKSETIYYRRGTVKQLDNKGRVINPDAVILTMNDKVDTPVLRKKKLQYDDNGNIIFEKGWQELQYDENGKPLLDEKGHPVLIDIREPLYPNEYYSQNKKDAQSLHGDNKSKNGKIYKKKLWKKATVKHSDISDNDNITRLRQKWQDYQNEYFAKHNVLDEDGNPLKVDLRSYRKQNKERPASETLIPTVHVMPHYEKEDELKEYNENAKKHNNAVKVTRRLSRKIKDEEEKLKNTESNIIAIQQQSEDLYNRINPQKLFVDAWVAGYENMFSRRRNIEAEVLKNIETHLNANDVALQKNDRRTKRGEANHFRLSRHNSALFSFKHKLSRSIDKGYKNIRAFATKLFNKLSNANIVSFIRKHYDDNTANIVADVLDRTRTDVKNDKIIFPPDAHRNDAVLQKSANVIIGNGTDITAFKEKAVSQWNSRTGEAPPTPVLQVLDTYYTAEEYYISVLTEKKWKIQFFSKDEHPENINADYERELIQIAEAEKEEEKIKTIEPPKKEEPATVVWKQEEQDRLNAIRDNHYNNIVIDAQPYTSIDLRKTQRTKALKIMRELIFEDKDKLFKLYEAAAKAAKDYYELKPKETVKTTNIAPDDRSRTQSNTNARKK